MYVCNRTQLKSWLIMRTITYLFFILFTSCYLVNVSAQTRPITLGVRAGVNFSNSSTTIDEQSYELNGKDGKTGFLLGITADFKISETLYFQSGLSFTTKGVIFKEENTYVHGMDPNNRRNRELKVNLSYIQLPLMGAYKAKLSSNTKLVISAGPYLAYGIGGKIKSNSTFTSGGGYQPNDDDLNSFGERTFKRFDFGLGTGVGLEFKSYCLNFNYEWGLSNINRDSHDSDIVPLFHKGYKNRNASLTLGYKF